MNRRAFVRRLAAGVLAASMLRDGLMWRGPRTDFDDRYDDYLVRISRTMEIAPELLRELDHGDTSYRAHRALMDQQWAMIQSAQRGALRRVADRVAGDA